MRLIINKLPIFVGVVIFTLLLGTEAVPFVKSSLISQKSLILPKYNSPNDISSDLRNSSNSPPFKNHLLPINSPRSTQHSKNASNSDKSTKAARIKKQVEQARINLIEAINEFEKRKKEGRALKRDKYFEKQLLHDLKVNKIKGFKILNNDNRAKRGSQLSEDKNGQDGKDKIFLDLKQDAKPNEFTTTLTPIIPKTELELVDSTTLEPISTIAENEPTEPTMSIILESTTAAVPEEIVEVTTESTEEINDETSTTELDMTSEPSSIEIVEPTPSSVLANQPDPNTVSGPNPVPGKTPVTVNTTQNGQRVYVFVYIDNPHPLPLPSEKEQISVTPTNKAPKGSGTTTESDLFSKTAMEEDEIELETTTVNTLESGSAEIVETPKHLNLSNETPSKNESLKVYIDLQSSAVGIAADPPTTSLPAGQVEETVDVTTENTVDSDLDSVETTINSVFSEETKEDSEFTTEPPVESVESDTSEEKESQTDSVSPSSEKIYINLMGDSSSEEVTTEKNPEDENYTMTDLFVSNDLEITIDTPAESIELDVAETTTEQSEENQQLTVRPPPADNIYVDLKVDSSNEDFKTEESSENIDVEPKPETIKASAESEEISGKQPSTDIFVDLKSSKPSNEEPQTDNLRENESDNSDISVSSSTESTESDIAQTTLKNKQPPANEPDKNIYIDLQGDSSSEESEKSKNNPLDVANDLNVEVTTERLVESIEADSTVDETTEKAENSVTPAITKIYIDLRNDSPKSPKSNSYTKFQSDDEILSKENSEVPKAEEGLSSSENNQEISVSSEKVAPETDLETEVEEVSNGSEENGDISKTESETSVGNAESSISEAGGENMEATESNEKNPSEISEISGEKTGSNISKTDPENTEATASSENDPSEKLIDDDESTDGSKSIQMSAEDQGGVNSQQTYSESDTKMPTEGPDVTNASDEMSKTEANDETETNIEDEIMTSSDDSAQTGLKEVRMMFNGKRLTRSQLSSIMSSRKNALSKKAKTSPKVKNSTKNSREKSMAWEFSRDENRKAISKFPKSRSKQERALKLPRRIDRNELYLQTESKILPKGMEGRKKKSLIHSNSPKYNASFQASTDIIENIGHKQYIMKIDKPHKKKIIKLPSTTQSKGSQDKKVKAPKKGANSKRVQHPKTAAKRKSERTTTLRSKLISKAAKPPGRAAKSKRSWIPIKQLLGRSTTEEPPIWVIIKAGKRKNKSQLKQTPTSEPKIFSDTDSNEQLERPETATEEPVWINVKKLDTETTAESDEIVDNSTPTFDSIEIKNTTSPTVFINIKGDDYSDLQPLSKESGENSDESFSTTPTDEADMSKEDNSSEISSGSGENLSTVSPTDDSDYSTDITTTVKPKPTTKNPTNDTDLPVEIVEDVLDVDYVDDPRDPFFFDYYHEYLLRGSYRDHRCCT